MAVELAFDHFLGGGHDGLAQLLVQMAQRHVGFGGGSLSAAGAGTMTGPEAGLASPSLRNCSPNWTPGSKKAVRAPKGICSGAGSFLKVRVTSKKSSFTFSAQYWC